MKGEVDTIYHTLITAFPRRVRLKVLKDRLSVMVKVGDNQHAGVPVHPAENLV